MSHMKVNKSTRSGYTIPEKYKDIAERVSRIESNDLVNEVILLRTLLQDILNHVDRDPDGSLVAYSRQITQIVKQLSDCLSTQTRVKLAESHLVGVEVVASMLTRLAEIIASQLQDQPDKVHFLRQKMTELMDSVNDCSRNRLVGN